MKLVAETSVAVLVVGIIFIFWMNGLEMNKKHIAIKLLYNLISLWLTVLAANIARLLAVGDGLSADLISNLEVLYGGLLYVVIFTSGYWIFMFVKDMLLNFGWLKGKKEVISEGDDVDG